jgi:hypothetical protein
MSRISDANRRVACCREAADAALRRVKARGDALQDVLGAHPVLLIGGGVIAGALAARPAPAHRRRRCSVVSRN